MGLSDNGRLIMLLHTEVKDPRTIKRFRTLLYDFRRVHGNTYEYTKVTYRNFNTKITITCPTHGDFEQLPGKHLKGSGCKACMTAKLTETFDSFCTRMRKKHKNAYEYLRYVHRGKEKLVVYRCGLHGIKLQRAAEHVRGKGCRKCASTCKDTTSSFILKAKKVHGDTYDYSSVVYVNSQQKVTIGCNKHGNFTQLPINHLNGCGCHLCAGYGGDGGFRTEKPGLLYYIRITRGGVIEYKIGITNNNVKQRFGYYYKYIEVLDSKMFICGKACKDAEKAILDNNKNQRIIGTILNSGKTECFGVDVYQNIQNYFK